MDSLFLTYAGLMLFGTFVSSVSQVMLKKAAQKTYSSKIQEYANPLVITAYILFFATTLLCIIAYRHVPLSLGPVLESTSYLFVTIFGALIFKESVTKKKLIALVLIIIGIVISSVWA